MPCCDLNCADHYPYEKLTDEVTANIQRMRDKQLHNLRRENNELKEKLWRYERVMPLLRAMGIDIDVVYATHQVLGD